MSTRDKLIEKQRELIRILLLFARRGIVEGDSRQLEADIYALESDLKAIKTNTSPEDWLKEQKYDPNAFYTHSLVIDILYRFRDEISEIKEKDEPDIDLAEMSYNEHFKKEAIEELANRLSQGVADKAKRIIAIINEEKNED